MRYVAEFPTCIVLTRGSQHIFKLWLEIFCKISSIISSNIAFTCFSLALIPDFTYEPWVKLCPLQFTCYSLDAQGPNVGLCLETESQRSVIWVDSNQMWPMPLEAENIWTLRGTWQVHVPRERAMWGHGEEVATCQPGEGPLRRANLLTPWPWTSAPSSVEKQCLLLKSPMLWYWLRQPEQTNKVLGLSTAPLRLSHSVPCLPPVYLSVLHARILFIYNYLYGSSPILPSSVFNLLLSPIHLFSISINILDSH